MKRFKILIGYASQFRMKSSQILKSRIVILGNGFDLAHNLKTSYFDFYDFLKGNIAKDDPFIAVSGNTNNLTLRSRSESHGSLFKGLFAKNEDFIKNWSNLEQFFYTWLLDNYWSKAGAYRVKLINDEFEHLKKLFVQYLHNEVESRIDLNDLTSFDLDPKIREIICGVNPENQIGFHTTTFINFNYTSKILKSYIYSMKADGRNFSNTSFIDSEIIQIHGHIEDYDSIVFGYGDEEGQDYQKLVQSGNDELLKHFKTFQYLQAEQYTRVMNLLEKPMFDLANPFELYIQVIGHSCAITDKALLKAIFTHKNVKRIELVLRKKEDSYLNKLIQVSRIFDDNIMMRRKIVPEPLTGKL